MFVLETPEELAPVDAVQHAGRPIERFHQSQRSQAAGLGHFFIQRADEGNVQRPFRGPPIEPRLRAGVVLVPADPGGEDAIEKRLHQRGAKEMLAFFVRTLHPQGVFQRRADALQGRKLLLLLDAEERVAGIGGHEPGHVFGIDQRGRMKAGPLDELDELSALLLGRGAGMRSLMSPELLFIAGQGEPLARDGLPVCAALEKQEFAEVGHDDDPVRSQVLLDLPAFGDRLHVGPGSLGLDRSAGGQLSGLGRAVGLPLELVGRKQPAVGHSRPEVAEIHDATDLGLERLSCRIEEGRKGRVVRCLGHAPARSVNRLQLGEVVFQDPGGQVGGGLRVCGPRRDV